jgi:hypothetical protein
MHPWKMPTTGEVIAVVPVACMMYCDVATCFWTGSPKPM